MRISSSNGRKHKHMKKGCWTKQEDEKLINYIKIHGEGCWSTLPKAAGLARCGKSCELRWMNYLRPDIKRGNFGHDEEDLIIKLHALLGNRWSLIAGRLPGRTDNEVKNYWNSHIKRKLISAGIDPDNHRIHEKIELNNYRATAKSSFSISTKQKSDDDDEAVSSSSTNLNLTLQPVVRPRAYHARPLPRPRPYMKLMSEIKQDEPHNFNFII